jgi:hypothetical protein
MVATAAQECLIRPVGEARVTLETKAAVATTATTP